jgi:nicotinamidase-related amidase
MASARKKSPDLHGNAPDHSPVVLLIVDMINDMEHPGGKQLLPAALAAARKIAQLKQRARQRKIPVIYANDNFGRWRSDFRQVVEHCLKDGVIGEPIAEVLKPDADDYFVLKAKHSAFHATPLDMLLEYLGARRLIVTGMRTEYCILFSAMDAYMRELELYVPRDCVASGRARDTRAALQFMQTSLRADTRAAAGLDLARLRKPRTREHS